MTEEELEKLRKDIDDINISIEEKNKEIRSLRMKLFALHSKEREELLKKRAAV